MAIMSAAEYAKLASSQAAEKKALAYQASGTGSGGSPTPQAFTPHVPSSNIPKASGTPVSPAPSTPAVPSAPSTPSYAGANEHQQWINNPASGMGGMDAYTKLQNQKFYDAVYSGNADMISKLRADADRVGYQLTIPTANVPTQQSQQGVAVPAHGGMNQIPIPSIAQREAQARAEQQAKMDALRNSVTTAKTSIQNDFSRAQKVIGDNRVLQAAQLLRTLNPRNGRTEYTKAMVGREQTLADEAAQKEITNRLGSYDAQLQDATGRSEAEIQARIQALQDNDRQYALQLQQADLAQRTFDANRSDNLFNRYTQTDNEAYRRKQEAEAAAWAKSENNPAYRAQLIATQIAEIKLSALPEQIKQEAALLQQEVEKGNLTLEQAKVQLDELKNPDSITNKARALENEIKEIQKNILSTESQYAGKLKEAQLNQILKQTAEIGKVRVAPHSEQDIEMDQIKLDTMREQLNQLKNGSNAKVDGKESVDTYNVIIGELDNSDGMTAASKKLGKSEKEVARMLIEQNKPYLSETDYRRAMDELNKRY